MRALSLQCSSIFVVNTFPQRQCERYYLQCHQKCTKDGLIVATFSKFQNFPKQRLLGTRLLPLLHQLQDVGDVKSLSHLYSCHGTHLSSYHGFSFTPKCFTCSMVTQFHSPLLKTCNISNNLNLETNGLYEERRREIHSGEKNP